MNSKESIKNLIEQVRDKRDLISKEGVDRYLKIGDTTIIRSLIQAIPSIGGSLDTMIFSKAEVIRRQRILDYIDALYKYINLVIKFIPFETPSITVLSPIQYL